MTARNDVTGDAIQTKTTSQQYRDNWDRIFGKKNKDTSTQEQKKDKDSKE